MAVVKKSNVELTIAEHLVDEYLEMGYSLLDESGKVVRRKKTDEETVSELKAQNRKLKNEIENLQKEIYALKSPHINSDEVSDTDPTNYTPKKTRANKGD